MKNYFSALKNIIAITLKDDCFGLASEMAFNFLLALFPFAVFIFAVLGMLGNKNVIYQIIEIMQVIVPVDVLNIIEEALNKLFKASSGKILTVGFVGTIWTSSNAVRTLMKGLNRVYGTEETRSFWQARFISVLIVFFAVFIMVFGSYLIIFAKVILNFLSAFIHISENISLAVLFLRWPISFLLLFLLLLITYDIGPDIRDNRNKQFYDSIPGALFFSNSWLLVSWGFSLYIENFGQYNAIYGSLGAAIVLMLWLYYTSLIILIGGEINSRRYLER